MRVVLEWFRDDDGEWTANGRRRELLVLVVGLPLFASSVAGELGAPWPASSADWVGLSLGVAAGFLYASRARDAIHGVLPGWATGWTILTSVLGGVGLSALELVRVATPTALFVLAAGTTALGVYLCRLCSPFHDGMKPPRRGVDPPGAAD